MEHIEALSKWKPGAAEFHRFEKHLDVLNRDSSDIRHLIELVDDKLNRLPKPQEPRGSSLIEGLRFIRDWKAAHADVLARTEELNVIREALQEHSSDNIDVILLVSGRFTDAADAHMRFSIAQLEQQGLLKDMFVELHIYASAVLPEESLLKTFLDKLIWRKGEDTTEYLVKMAVDDLGTLMSQFVPLASIFIHSFKDWRKRKVSLEEWVAGVKGLISSGRSSASGTPAVSRKTCSLSIRPRPLNLYLSLKQEVLIN